MADNIEMDDGDYGPIAAASPLAKQSMPGVVQGQLQSDRSAALTRAKGIQGAIDQRMQQYQSGANDLKQILAGAAEQLRNTPVGPTQAEQWQRMVAGYVASPVGAGAPDSRMATAAADSMAQRREAELAKQQLIAQYGLQAGQYGLQASQMGLNNLNSQENNAQTRLTSLDSALARSNDPNKLIIMGANGQPQVNQPVIDAKGKASGAEAAARMHAQMAGINDPTVQDGLMHTAQMIVDRKIPMPTISTRSPNGMAMSNALTGMVQSMDPDYNAQDYPIAKETRTKFVTGPEGNTVTSLNVAMTHLEAMRQWAAALNNGDIQLVNRMKNFFTREFGGAAPIDYNTAKQTVAGEATKAINGARGNTVTDRVEQADHFAAANSPEQQNGAIDTLQVLMGGQLHGKRQQFISGLRGVNPEAATAEFNKRLSPEVLALEERTQGGTNINGASHSGPKPTDADIAYLKAHPETAAKFKAHFGSLPEDVHGG